MKHAFSYFAAIINERVRESINYKDKGGVFESLKFKVYYLLDLLDTLCALMLATNFFDSFTLIIY